MKFIKLKKVGKFTYEFVKSGNNKYDIIMFKNDSIINQITISIGEISHLIDNTIHIKRIN